MPASPTECHVRWREFFTLSVHPQKKKITPKKKVGFKFTQAPQISCDVWADHLKELFDHFVMSLGPSQKLAMAPFAQAAQRGYLPFRSGKESKERIESIVSNLALPCRCDLKMTKRLDWRAKSVPIWSMCGMIWGCREQADKKCHVMSTR